MSSALPLWVATLLFFAASQVFGGTRLVGEHGKFLSPPPEYVEQFAFGFRESMADSFWLRWIQDSDTCQTYLKPVEKFVPAAEGGLDYVPRYKNCDNSWGFKMLDATTKLAPKFKMPYEAGAISLSVLTEDFVGSTVIFDRGLKEYPNDWIIAYRAAYHHIFDLKNHERGIELLLQAHKNGGPDWLPLLASRIASEKGQLEFGITLLENYKAGVKNEEGKKVIEKRIAGLRERLGKSKK